MPHQVLRQKLTSLYSCQANPRDVDKGGKKERKKSGEMWRAGDLEELRPIRREWWRGWRQLWQHCDKQLYLSNRDSSTVLRKLYLQNLSGETESTSEGKEGRIKETEVELAGRRALLSQGHPQLWRSSCLRPRTPSFSQQLLKVDSYLADEGL